MTDATPSVARRLDVPPTGIPNGKLEAACGVSDLDHPWLEGDR